MGGGDDDETRTRTRTQDTSASAFDSSFLVKLFGLSVLVEDIFGGLYSAMTIMTMTMTITLCTQSSTIFVHNLIMAQ